MHKIYSNLKGNPMKRIIALLTFVPLCLVTFCSSDFSPLDDQTQPNIRPLTKSEQQIVMTTQNFGLKLFREIVAEGDGDNVFISPLSVSMALGMTMNGAAGETYDAMRQTLAMEGMSEQEINEAYKSLIDLLLNLDPKVIFEIANSIWPQNGFNVLPSFMEVNQKYFYSEAKPLDFTQPDAANVINNWISEKTHGKIKNMLDDIPNEAIMYLINAIYFKGTWTYQFDEEQTGTEDFYINPQNPVECQMMHISGNWKYYEDDDVKIIDLPYGDSLFSMTVMLPSVDHTINNFISQLTISKWENYISSMDYQSGSLTLPKLKLGYKLTMNDVLKALGMGIAFNGSADFSRINGEKGIYISRVLHQTFVQVDEEGTEAAAATIVEFIRSALPAGFFMQVNRPYIFVIREQTNNTIIFIGKITKPVWNENL
jgi:serine protease inhibitor